MLLSPDEKEWIGKWLNKARADMRRAHQLAAAPADYEAAAFFCQQAVEKYFKARLLSLGIEPARTHDLERLQNELSPVETFSADEQDQARLLTPYAVLFRYPQDDEDDIPMDQLLAVAHHFQQRITAALGPLLH